MPTELPTVCVAAKPGTMHPSASAETAASTPVTLMFRYTMFVSLVNGFTLRQDGGFGQRATGRGDRGTARVVLKKAILR